MRVVEEIPPDDPAVSRLGIPDIQEGGDRHPSGSLNENFVIKSVSNILFHQP